MPDEPRVLQDRVAVRFLEERYQKLTSELSANPYTEVILKKA